MMYLIIACITALFGLLLLRKRGINDNSLGMSVSLFILSIITVVFYFATYQWNLSIDDRGIFYTLGGIVCLFLIPGSVAGVVNLFTNNEAIIEKASGYGCLAIVIGGILFTTINLGGVILDNFLHPEPDCIIMENGQSNCTDVEGGPGDNGGPGLHEVEGHIRDGTYVEPYIRSDPDGNSSNNLNP